MPITKSRIQRNLQKIREDIASACDRTGRLPEEVSIVAVTKTVEIETIKNLLDIGLTDLGESQIQQLTTRAAELGAYLQRRRSDLPTPLRWHMIGHLQRNKARAALESADVIHSIDSLRLAEELNTRAERMDKLVSVFLQVNCSQENQKFGCAVGASTHLADMICSLRQLRLLGLMTMAPLSEDPELSRPSFVRLRELFEEMRKEKIGGKNFRHLSMGMSQDYVTAVEEGATVLRIGTALFQ